MAGGTVWYLLSLVPGEGHVELGEDSLLLEAGQLLPVQVVLALVAAAVVQHCLAHLFACRVTQPPSAGPCQPPALSPPLVLTPPAAPNAVLSPTLGLQSCTMVSGYKRKLGTDSQKWPQALESSL